MSSFLETAELKRFGEVRANKRMLPAGRGIYGLFFSDIPAGVPVSGCLDRDRKALLYVGTAGADLRKKGNLRRRLGRDHLGGNERLSTFCRTLAVLLPELAGDPVVKIERGKPKLHTSREGQQRLREWMDWNVFVCWTEHANPAEMERDLVRNLRPPLNIEFSDHPFSGQLVELRLARSLSALSSPPTHCRPAPGTTG